VDVGVSSGDAPGPPPCRYPPELPVSFEFFVAVAVRSSCDIWNSHCLRFLRILAPTDNDFVSGNRLRHSSAISRDWCRSRHYSFPVESQAASLSSFGERRYRLAASRFLRFLEESLGSSAFLWFFFFLELVALSERSFGSPPCPH